MARHQPKSHPPRVSLSILFISIALPVAIDSGET